MNKTINVRSKGKKWVLPIVIPFQEDPRSIGTLDILYEPHFYEVIDYRPPKEGEHYISGAEPMAYRAPNDLSNPFLIARKTYKAVHKEVWVRDEKIT